MAQQQPRIAYNGERTECRRTVIPFAHRSSTGQCGCVFYYSLQITFGLLVNAANAKRAPRILSSTIFNCYYERRLAQNFDRIVSLSDFGNSLRVSLPLTFAMQLLLECLTLPCLSIAVSIRFLFRSSLTNQPPPSCCGAIRSLRIM